MQTGILTWIRFSNFVQAFPVVVPYNKSVFDRILLKASQCYQKCHCFNGVNIFFKRCSNISAHLLLLRLSLVIHGPLRRDHCEAGVPTDQMHVVTG